MRKLSKELLHTEYIVKRKSIRKIGKKVGWSYAGLRKRLIEYGIPLRTRVEALIGHKHSKATKRKISKAHMGMKASLETCAKIRKRMTGIKNPKYGSPGAKNPN